MSLCKYVEVNGMSKKSNWLGILVAIAALVLVIDVSLMLGIFPNQPLNMTVTTPEGTITLSGWSEVIVAIGGGIGLAIGLAMGIPLWFKQRSK